MHDLIYSEKESRAYKSIIETFDKIYRQECPNKVAKGRKYYINPTYTKKDRNIDR